MNASLIPFPARRGRYRISIEQMGFRPDDLRWVVACSCGHADVRHDREDARRARRQHQAEHDRAVQVHPAGKGRPGGGAA
ncbi:MAG: hypothetical protein ACTH6N_05080 [Brachybacterium tyrofermentans]|uniref:hypothetical protein n=1 Tax=Brachybacterium tyrofermentans TaxID=47848 RepID=UPI001868AA70|nr:hypothetical protein [Brachybacterium tyrofermentans]